MNPTNIVPPSREFPNPFWPILLMGGGVILLLVNLGVLSTNGWSQLWQLWPLLLVAIGVDILFGRKSVLGALVGVLLALVVLALAVAVLFAGFALPL